MPTPLAFTTAAITSVPGFADPVSSWTHLGAAAVALVLGVGLVRRGRGLAARLSLGVFVFSAVFLLSMSGVYHLLDHGSPGREVLQRLDHAGIWVLIAGTFTPLHVLPFRRPWMRWGVLTGIWTVAVTGLVLKTIFFHELPEWVGLVFYLGLGWMGIVTGLGLRKLGRSRGLRLLIGGGVAYSVGGIVEGAGWPTLIPGVMGPHELFHVAVLVGLALHWKLAACLADIPLGAFHGPGGPHAPRRGDGPEAHSVAA